jgi:hypothetical protein
VLSIVPAVTAMIIAAFTMIITRTRFDHACSQGKRQKKQCQTGGLHLIFLSGDANSHTIGDADSVQPAS